MLSDSEIISKFQAYLKQTELITIKITGIKEGELIGFDMAYIHRWKEEYKKRLLAKFYKLDEWFASNNLDATFFTFTTRQQDFQFKADQYTFLKKNFQKVRDNMRKMKGKFSYIWVAEPHKSGYAHIHMLAFTAFTDDEKETVKRLWCDKYNAGVREALDIQEIKAVDDFGEHQKTGSHRLQSPKNYILKYLKKTFNEKDTDLSYFLFSATAWYMGRKGIQEYEKNNRKPELVTGWYPGKNEKIKENDYHMFRFYGSSRDLSSIMKLDDSESDFITLKVALNTGTSENDEPIELYRNTHFKEEEYEKLRCKDVTCDFWDLNSSNPFGTPQNAENNIDTVIDYTEDDSIGNDTETENDETRELEKLPGEVSEGWDPTFEKGCYG